MKSELQGGVFSMSNESKNDIRKSEAEWVLLLEGYINRDCTRDEFAKRRKRFRSGVLDSYLRLSFQSFGVSK